MIETIDNLIRGDTRIGSYYLKAVERWKLIMGRVGARDPDILAEILSREQVLFEDDCNGNRRLAQELIAVVGIAQWYDVGSGFDGHAGDLLLIRRAIERSSCSTEVKFVARNIAAYFRLNPLPES